MTVSEAHKKGNRKWDKENMITLGCKIKRLDAEIFKEYAKSQGKNTNGLLKEYDFKCNEEFIKNKANE